MGSSLDRDNSESFHPSTLGASIASSDAAARSPAPAVTHAAIDAASQTDTLASRSHVSLVVPDDVKRKVGDISAHVQDRLETELIAQAVDAWKALQIMLVQSFAELNVPGSPQRVPLIGPQRFPLEDFLRDALDQVGSALMNMGAARVTTLSGSLAEVSLGFDRQAVPGNAEPRNALRLLQIIERIRRLTDEDANKRVAYVAQLQALEADKLRLATRRASVPPGDNHVNDPIRRDIDRDIARNDAEIVKVRTAITNIDNSKLIPSLTTLVGKMLNTPYQPGQLSQTVAAFIQAVREVPLVASRVSPNELGKLPGDISLQISVDLPEPKLEQPAELSSRTVSSRPSFSKSVSVRPFKIRKGRSTSLNPKPNSSRDDSFDFIRFSPTNIIVLNSDKLFKGSKGTGISRFDERGKPRSTDDIINDLFSYVEAHIDQYVPVYEVLTGTFPVSGSLMRIEFIGDGYIVYINNIPSGSFSDDLLPMSMDNMIALAQVVLHR